MNCRVRRALKSLNVADMYRLALLELRRQDQYPDGEEIRTKIPHVVSIQTDRQLVRSLVHYQSTVSADLVLAFGGGSVDIKHTRGVRKIDDDGDDSSR